MPSERVQRRIDRLLDQAEESADQRDWLAILELTAGVLEVDPENEDALEFAEKAGYVRETVWTQMEYAEMLLDRAEGASSTSARDSDREKAIALQGEALAITQKLGMRPLTERILARREILRA